MNISNRKFERTQKLIGSKKWNIRYFTISDVIQSLQSLFEKEYVFVFEFFSNKNPKLIGIGEIKKDQNENVFIILIESNILIREVKNWTPKGVQLKHL